MEIRAASNMSTLLVGESVGAGNEDTPHRAGLDGGAWAARLSSRARNPAVEGRGGMARASESVANFPQGLGARILWAHRQRRRERGPEHPFQGQGHSQSAYSLGTVARYRGLVQGQAPFLQEGGG